MDTNNEWIRDESETERATYYKGDHYSERCGYVCQYQGTDNYNWQDIRGEHRLSDIVVGADAAMAACDASMELTDDEFNARVAAELIRRLKKLEKQLLELQPETTLLPGYHAGFDVGYAKARDAVLAVLEVN